jgi:hypothetical protein
VPVGHNQTVATVDAALVVGAVGLIVVVIVLAARQRIPRIAAGVQIVAMLCLIAAAVVRSG